MSMSPHTHIFPIFFFLFTASVSINRAGIATLLLLFVYFVVETYEAEYRFWIIPTYSIMNVRHTTLCVCNVCKKKDLIPPRIENIFHFPSSNSVALLYFVMPANANYFMNLTDPSLLSTTTTFDNFNGSVEKEKRFILKTNSWAVQYYK